MAWEISISGLCLFMVNDCESVSFIWVTSKTHVVCVCDLVCCASLGRACGLGVSHGFGSCVPPLCYLFFLHCCTPGDTVGSSVTANFQPPLRNQHCVSHLAPCLWLSERRPSLIDDPRTSLWFSWRTSDLLDWCSLKHSQNKQKRRGFAGNKSCFFVNKWKRWIQSKRDELCDDAADTSKGFPNRIRLWLSAALRLCNFYHLPPKTAAFRGAIS